MKTLLHVGCGHQGRESTHGRFHGAEWNHVRVDIDPNVKPDVVDDIATLSTFEDGCCDGVFSSHNLEHLHMHDISGALKSFYRVLRPQGVLVITMPDLQSACEVIAQGRGLETLYVSPAGPISAIDIVFGHRALSAQNAFMAHRSGLTASWLHEMILDIGFLGVSVLRQNAHYALWAFAHR